MGMMGSCAFVAMFGLTFIYALWVIYVDQCIPTRGMEKGMGKLEGSVGYMVYGSQLARERTVHSELHGIPATFQIVGNTRN